MKSLSLLCLACGFAGMLLGWSPSPAGAVDITIDCSKTHQTIEGFGTCIVDWGTEMPALYAQKSFQENYVHDLGATLVRIPLDPHVMDNEVADARQISYKQFTFTHPRPKIAVDWANAIYHIDPKTIRVFGSVWSPPHWMKEGDKMDKGNTCGGRLRPDRYEHFARYLAQWIIGLKELYGVPLYAVSLQNELEFKEPYNSCVYKPAEYQEMLRTVGRVFKELNIDTKIMGPETMTSFVDRNMNFIRPVMEDPETAKYLQILCSHGYTDGVQSSGTAEENTGLWSRVKGYDRQLWMTETGGGDWQWEDGAPAKDNKGRAKPKYGALNGLGSMMHNALVYGNVSAWTLWQIAESKPSGGGMMVMDKPSKKYQVTKHYSRFLRPGALRVDAAPDGQDNVSVSAFTHPTDHTLTIVLLNHDTAAHPVTLNLAAAPKPSAFAAYRTSAAEDFAKLPEVSPQAGKLSLDLPPMSMVTLQAKTSK